MILRTHWNCWCFVQHVTRWFAEIGCVDEWEALSNRQALVVMMAMPLIENESAQDELLKKSLIENLKGAK